MTNSSLPAPESALRRESALLLATVQYFTRLPAPAWVGHSRQRLNDGARYLPLVGVLVGTVGAFAFVLADRFVPQSVAVLLSAAATIWLTRAFHEDGLADAIDGIGGGQTRERMLTIMRDSRIGTCGVVGLVLVLGIKIACLMILPAAMIPAALIAGHAVSRAGAVTIIASLHYVREEPSRAQPVVRTVSAISVWIAMSTAAAAIALVSTTGLPSAWIGLIATAFTTILWRWQLARLIGGYSGDCLGAAQQFGEVAFYLGVLATWST